MDIIQQGIQLLLKSAITQEPQILPKGFDMEEAYPLIRKHHIVTLCYDGAVRCGISRQHPVMEKLFYEYFKLMQISERQTCQIERIFRAFDEKGIDYMPLKGCNMKALYPQPELRVMGDADILIRKEQYEKIVPVMDALGFTSVLESDHELIWQSPSLYLELHKSLIPSYNKDYYKYFGDGWKFAKASQGNRWDMTAEDTYLYLFTHFAKHYRDGGIGCRHVVDLWVYRKKNRDLDERYIRTVLDQLRLQTFHDYICRLLGVWFEGEAMDHRTEILTACIFAGGSWGNKEDNLLSNMIRESRSSALPVNGRLVHIWNMLFPSPENMCRLYPFLKKMPWMLPVAWLIRPVYKVLFQNRKIKRQIQKMGAVSQQKLDARQEMLRYVGLDYHF